ncbi:hypothetical protein [Actinomyces qiguomingii]|uniref:hypothetical protein n=1 Tax=Actinomyces qiguomingii TaxID=2057800 RepID=UPI000CA036BF|nr:hypothetical protein [Actinomyces qiguomingii]
MADKITVTTSLSKISAIEAETSPEPFRVGIGKSKYVTFPAIQDLPFEQADHVLTMLNHAEEYGEGFSLQTLLASWLSEKDYKALQAANPSMRTVAAMIKQVNDYYEEAAGTEGEDASSASA